MSGKNGKKDVVKLRLAGRLWRLLFVSKLPQDIEGFCDNPAKKDKCIRVLRHLRGERKLTVLIHEMLHATNWELAEHHVDQVSMDIARALWRLGYRDTTEQE